MCPQKAWNAHWAADQTVSGCAYTCPQSALFDPGTPATSRPLETRRQLVLSAERPAAVARGNLVAAAAGEDSPRTRCEFVFREHLLSFPRSPVFLVVFREAFKGGTSKLPLPAMRVNVSCQKLRFLSWKTSSFIRTLLFFRVILRGKFCKSFMKMEIRK